MFLNYSITFIIPAKNEEKNIPFLFKKIEKLNSQIKDLRVLFYDDGSTDKTFQVASKLFGSSKIKFKITKNETSLNLGGVFKQGLIECDSEYVMVVQGQDDISYEEIIKILLKRETSTKDLIIPSQKNWKERPILRQILSRSFVKILNTIFSLNIAYYNHSVIMRTSDVNKIFIETNSYCFQAEILIKLIINGATYEQVDVMDTFAHKTQTNAFKIKNIIGTIFFILKLLNIKLNLILNERLNSN